MDAARSISPGPARTAAAPKPAAGSFVPAVSADEARARAYSMPLEDFDVSKGKLFQADAHWPFFERLRREEPVHYCQQSYSGPYWSITKYHDIMKVEVDHQTFSSDSALGGIGLSDRPSDFRYPSFIAMDEPEHRPQRMAVAPMFTPTGLAQFEDTIRARVGAILDDLPRNETFNWVERVSIELTTQMLATLFDFPFEERRRLTYWSDIATANLNAGIIASEAERDTILQECFARFVELWNERVNAEPRPDLISMLAHSPATRNMDRNTYFGNIILLTVGGNDTTRNSISGGLFALNQFPDQYRKLRDNPALVDALVPEIIRWQTPLAYMRRTALRDVEFADKQIKKGDKVVMWYVSGNRDEEVFERADDFIIGRAKGRNHLSFGFGIHRCVGLRLAEMQLRVLWQEILKRFPVIEVVGEPKRVLSSFIRGYEVLPVRVPAA
jgi:cytochrome P450